LITRIVRGVENVARSHEINIILCNSDFDFDKEEEYIRRLFHSGVSGLIIVPIVSKDAGETYRLYSQLTEFKMPFVFCNRNVEGVNAPAVAVSNDYYGAYIATKHLLEKGYRHIAYIADKKSRTGVDRCQGYLTALLERGREVPTPTVITNITLGSPTRSGCQLSFITRSRKTKSNRTPSVAITAV
jgi:DNA-binding LacI/PurR family transcriptional regulator